MIIEKLSGTKAHQRYYLEDGTLAVGVTTVVGILSKPALVKWANKLGLEGTDVTKYVDKTAEIGICAHYLVQCQPAESELHYDKCSNPQIVAKSKELGILPPVSKNTRCAHWEGKQ